MITIKKLVSSFLVLIALMSCKDNTNKKEPMEENTKLPYYSESYRPQFHFSPEEKWMNDPNGLVFHKGVYHLFYQYYPEDIVWGPMHWGHAVSPDLIHWEHKPVALYPDENGYIFSGSAVVDEKNTSGFGSVDAPPLVAIFTYHNAALEKEGRNDYQTQGIAYSLDNGDSWIMYEGNPVIGNDGIKDFRDPKVFWNEKANVWTMLLVAGDYLQIYNSDNLKLWKKVSEFGKDQGAHGGVWECPDLFPFTVNGTEKWVLLISINPGAPNGGSGTQYFVGDFDGKTFTSNQKEHRWVDWGTDNYAGVTFNNVPSDDRVFIGWMSNWAYAQDTPTEKWRSATTIPRKLALQKIGDSYELMNYPLNSFDGIVDEKTKRQIVIENGGTERISFDHLNQGEIRFTTKSKDFKMVFKNSLEEELVLTMNGEKGEFLLDRSNSGKTGFKEDFGGSVQNMPINNLPEGEFEVRILMDWSSVEIFINKGQYVMTAQIFPNEIYTSLEIENTSNQSFELKDFELGKVGRVW